MASRRFRAGQTLLHGLRWELCRTRRQLLRLAQSNGVGEAIVKHLIFALTGLVVGSTAHAGERYLEVWNPPEARLAHRGIVHKPVQHHRLAFHPRHDVRRHKIVASIPTVARPAAESKTAGTPKPSFDDIPRQLTPEGNVLRVRGSQRVEVQR